MGAELSPRIAPLAMERDRHAEGTALPRRLEDELAVLARRGNLVGQARRRILQRDCHRAAASPGGDACATPTIESRLTSAASSVSSIPPVPAGRSGRTM